MSGGTRFERLFRVKISPESEQAFIQDLVNEFETSWTIITGQIAWVGSDGYGLDYSNLPSFLARRLSFNYNMALTATDRSKALYVRAMQIEDKMCDLREKYTDAFGRVMEGLDS